MNNDEVVRRILALEAEARALRQQHDPKRLHTIYQSARQGIEFFAKVVPALTLLTAVLLGIYGWRKYDVINVLEGQRQASVAKNLSRVYTQTGNELLRHQQYVAAEDSFLRALEYRRDNEDATFGLEITRVVKPEQGSKLVSLDIMKVKIESLLKTFPDNKDNRLKRAQIYLIKSQFYMLVASVDGANLKEAQAAAQEAIRLDPASPAGYIQSGYVRQLDADLDAACALYDTALSKSPLDSIANNNVGFCALMNLDYAKAATTFEKATNESFNILTHVNLTSAYLYQGRREPSLRLARYVLGILERPDVGNEAGIAGAWLMNHMPLAVNDRITHNRYVQVSAIEHKRAIAHLYLALALAGQDKLDEAATELASARKLDTLGELTPFFDNRLLSAANLAPVSAAAKTWLSGQTTSQ